LPTFYNDNYVSVLPGESKAVIIDYTQTSVEPVIEVNGWNTGKHQYQINQK
jgi:hypothetical protein